MVRKFTEKASYVLIKQKNIGGNFMSKWTGLLEQIERYLRTQNNEDLCSDSEDLIEFIETVRDDELVRRMEQAGEINTPPVVTGDNEQIIE